MALRDPFLHGQCKRQVYGGGLPQGAIGRFTHSARRRNDHYVDPGPKSNCGTLGNLSSRSTQFDAKTILIASFGTNYRVLQ